MNDLSYIFLLSTDRSGSNLCLRLLGAHSDIAAPPTSQLLPNLYKAEDRYRPLEKPENWGCLLRNTEALHRAGFGQWTNYAALSTDLADASHRTVETILKSIFTTEATAQGASKIAIKAHRAYEYATKLRTDFPNAKFIHLSRDPRDMALSWLKTPALRGGVARAADIWRHEQAGLIELVGTLGGNLYRLKYEDILASPIKTLIDLCVFLEISYDPDMLKFHQQIDTQNIAGHVQAWNNLAKPLMSQNLNKYKTGLTLEQRAHVESVCAPQMKQLGYVCDLDLAQFDLAAIQADLEANAPWEKLGYMALSRSERDSHEILRNAVKTLTQGPHLKA